MVREAFREHGLGPDAIAAQLASGSMPAASAGNCIGPKREDLVVTWSPTRRPIATITSSRGNNHLFPAILEPAQDLEESRLAATANSLRIIWQRFIDQSFQAENTQFSYPEHKHIGA